MNVEYLIFNIQAKEVLWLPQSSKAKGKKKQFVQLQQVLWKSHARW